MQQDLAKHLLDGAIEVWSVSAEAGEVVGVEERQRFDCLAYHAKEANF